MRSQDEFIKIGNKPKKLRFEEKTYKSFAANINSRCDLFIESLVRFFETKFHMLIKELSMEFFLLDNGSIWLSGCDKIDFCFRSGEQYQGDISSLVPVKVIVVL